MNSILPLNKKFLKQFIFSLLLVMGAGFSLLSTLVLRGMLPNLVFILLYHWGINRVFDTTFLLVVIGAMYDIVWGYPLGFHCLLLLSINRIMYYQGRYIAGKDFAILWVGAMGMYGVYLCLYSVLSRLSLQGPVVFKNIFYQFLITIFFYPLVMRFIIPLEKKMLTSL